MIEFEHGVPIPGEILPEGEWTRTAFKTFPSRGPLVWREVFGRDAPVVIDLGCGNGRFTLASALAHPEHDHFAIDVLPVVIRYATRRANQRGIRNARFGVIDGERLLHDYVPAGSVSAIHVYHPQPFHDHRQAHKRLITPQFMADVARGLSLGGTFVIQTDNPEYWTYLRELVPCFLDFQERFEPWPDAPLGRTRREILARARGLLIYRGEARKSQEQADAALLRVAARLPLPRFRTRGPWRDLDREESRL